ncbi:hypothetical protein [Janibacter melonis]|uniref:hypothetical protein n=1 Tax=Janibacter melonis TaxID=262209 RepID=UPI00177CC599
MAAAQGLTAAAVAGRALSYVLMAAALVALLRAMEVDRWLAIAPVGVFLTAQSLVAGEWMVGGAESKALAYPAVVAAVAAAAGRRSGWSGLMLGASLSMHALVGVWAGVALVVGVALAGAREVRFRAHLAKGVARFAGGVVVTGAWGLWAVLRTLLDGGEGYSGWAIYVSFRVSHHVLPADWRINRDVPWQLWIGLAVVIALVLLVRAAWRWRVVAGVVLASSGIFAAGLGIDAARRTELLRFYWFRLADSWVPLATSLLAAGVLTWAWSRAAGSRGRLLLRAAAGLVILAMAGHLTSQVVDQRRRALAMEREHTASAERATQRWAATHLPDAAVVAADPGADTWYADGDRAAFALYKASPQSARDVATWAERLRLLSGEDVTEGGVTRRDLVVGHGRLDGAALEQLCRAGATHYVARRTKAPWPAVLLHAERGWGVFALTREDGSCATAGSAR